MVTRVLYMLSADKKWVALPTSTQYGCSIMVHLVVFAALALLSQTLPRLGNNVSELLIKFESTSAMFHEGPRGAEPDANSNTDCIPAPKIATASNPVQVPLENLPRPVPILSLNRTQAKGKRISEKPANQAKAIGPSLPVSVMQCNVPVLLPHEVDGRETASLITPTSPEAAQEESGATNSETAIVSVIGTGAPVAGATIEELPNKLPGGVLADSSGPGRPGAWDVNVISVSVIPGPHGDTLFHDFGPYLLVYNFQAGSSHGKPLESFINLDKEAARYFELCEQSTDPKEARQCALETIRILNFAVPLLYRDNGPGNTDMTMALTRLGAAYVKLDEPDHAAYYFKHAMQILERLKPLSREWAWSSLNYAEALTKSKQYTDARMLLSTYVPTYKQLFGENSPFVLRVYKDLATVSFLTDKPEEGSQFDKKARELARLLLVR